MERVLSKTKWKIFKYRAVYVFSTVFRLPTDPNSFGNFLKHELQYRYRVDQSPLNEWCLVYNNRASSLFYTMIGWSTLFGIGVSTLMALDFWHNDGNFNIENFKVLQRHAYDLGMLKYIVYASILPTVLSVLWFQRLTLFSIYMNRRNPELVRVYLSNGSFRRHWVEVKRTEIMPNSTMQSETENYLAFYLHGNVRVCNTPRLVHTGGFRTSMIQTYILNDTHVEPSIIKNLDLDLFDQGDAKWS